MTLTKGCYMSNKLRVPGSIRAEGQTSIAIDKPTRAKLKELAGDMPVSKYVKGLAFGYITPGGGAQEPFPGQERSVSENTLPAISSKLDRLLGYMSALDAPVDESDPILALIKILIDKSRSRTYLEDQAELGLA